jgi:hypothetical protein
MPAVAHDPVQVRSGHAARRADATDDLAGLNRIALLYVLPAQVQVAGDETGAVVDDAAAARPAATRLRRER